MDYADCDNEGNKRRFTNFLFSKVVQFVSEVFHAFVFVPSTFSVAT